MSGTRQVPVEEIAPNPQNPRESFDDEKIAELAESIDEKGLLQAILVRPTEAGLEVVHGDRRLRAVKSLGHDTIKAEVRDLDDAAALEVAITENLQRENVSPLAEARAYQQLIDEYDITQAEAAERLGVSQSKISNQLRLLDLPDPVQRGILCKILSPWQGRIIGSVWDQWNLLDLTIDADLSVSELRDVKSQLQDGKELVHYTRRWDIERLEPLLGDRDLTELFAAEDRRQSFKSRERTHALVWAKENIPLYESLESKAIEESEVGPVVVSHSGIVFGEHCVRLALKEGYEGEMPVKVNIPRRVLQRVEVSAGDAGGEASA